VPRIFDEESLMNETRMDQASQAPDIRSRVERRCTTPGWVPRYAMIIADSVRRTRETCLKRLALSVLILFCVAVPSGWTTGPARSQEPSRPVVSGRSVVAAQERATYPPVKINDTETRHLKSQYTGEDYEIDIYLPRGYRQAQESYPAVYVLDAEYNFGCVSYIARRLIKNGDISKLILVGIAYGPDDEDYYYKTRMRDCTPPSEIHGYHTGGVENFIKFFETELFPFIEANYRVQKQNRTIVGHSIGGFFCGYALFNHPGIFENYLIVSPSFWFSDGVVFRYEEAFAKKGTPMNATVFLATGAAESDRMVKTTEEFISVMKSRNYKNLRFRFLLPEGEHHRSIFPYAFTRGLQFIFGRAQR
jgi:predicted alpha/beta superfamily hydrolase